MTGGGVYFLLAGFTVIPAVSVFNILASRKRAGLAERFKWAVAAVVFPAAILLFTSALAGLESLRNASFLGYVPLVFLCVAVLSPLFVFLAFRLNNSRSD